MCIFTSAVTIAIFAAATPAGAQAMNALLDGCRRA
jgi:hypothetical protein